MALCGELALEEAMDLSWNDDQSLLHYKMRCLCINLLVAAIPLGREKQKTEGLERSSMIMKMPCYYTQNPYGIRANPVD